MRAVGMLRVGSLHLQTSKVFCASLGGAHFEHSGLIPLPWFSAVSLIVELPTWLNVTPDLMAGSCPHRPKMNEWWDGCQSSNSQVTRQWSSESHIIFVHKPLSEPAYYFQIPSLSWSGSGDMEEMYQKHYFLGLLWVSFRELRIVSISSTEV